MEIRDQIAQLIAAGYIARNGIRPEVADMHAANLLDIFEQAMACPRCGAAIDKENVLAGTVWSPA